VIKAICCRNWTNQLTHGAVLDAIIAERALQKCQISKIFIVKFARMTTVKTACGKRILNKIMKMTLFMSLRSKYLLLMLIQLHKPLR
jgi:hypothetical protein